MGSRVDMKVVLLGKEYGGKTSMVERFIHDRFSENIPYQNTIGAAFGAKAVSVDLQKITLGIWDTAGSERYEAMSKIYYRGARAAIVCFDLTDSTSWERAKFWVNEVRAHEETCKLYLAGTKQDLLSRRAYASDIHDVMDYADLIGAKYFETSSKTGENIEELFHAIAKDFLNEPKLQMDMEDGGHKVKLGAVTSPPQQTCHLCGS